MERKDSWSETGINVNVKNTRTLRIAPAIFVRIIIILLGWTKVFGIRCADGTGAFRKGWLIFFFDRSGIGHIGTLTRTYAVSMARRSPGAFSVHDVGVELL